MADSDQPYSVRELDAKFEEIRGMLKAIHEQTLKTNGRVNKHDEKIGDLNTRFAVEQTKTRSYIAMVTGSVSTIISVVTFYLLHKYFN